MANPEHLTILKQGVEAWNAWREQNPGIRPDLEGANLQRANLQGADLQEANLRGANLFGAKLLVANLRKADLRGAKLKGAKLQGANLHGANLRRADLRGADLEGANLHWANLQKADLKEVDLRKAELWGTDLQRADLNQTQFSSRKALNTLSYPLTDEQLAGAIFEDEQDAWEKQEGAQIKESSLRIEFKDKTPWTPMLMAKVLGGLNMTYNRLWYLQTTKETDPKAIARTVERPDLYPDRNHDIGLYKLSYSSPGLIEVAPMAALLGPAAVPVAITAVGAGILYTVAKAWEALQNGLDTREDRLKKLNERKAKEKKKGGDSDGGDGNLPVPHQEDEADGPDDTPDCDHEELTSGEHWNEFVLKIKFRNSAVEGDKDNLLKNAFTPLLHTFMTLANQKKLDVPPTITPPTTGSHTLDGGPEPPALDNETPDDDQDPDK